MGVCEEEASHVPQLLAPNPRPNRAVKLTANRAINCLP